MRRMLLIFLMMACGAAACHAREVDRIAAARARSEANVRSAFAKAGVAYPPRELFLRGFKKEARLEMWARNAAGPFRLIRSYPILFSSGSTGPKRKEGDLQVPEGFYEIAQLNPASLYHLSLGLNYPNASDRVRADREKPGSEIYIHGKKVSIGCIPIGDDGIEEVFLAAWDSRASKGSAIHVHLFPAVMAGEEWLGFVEANPAHKTFWAELQPVYAAFEHTHRVPAVSVAADGAYRLEH